jgi:hypothetical protein
MWQDALVKDIDAGASLEVRKSRAYHEATDRDRLMKRSHINKAR